MTCKCNHSLCKVQNRGRVWNFESLFMFDFQMLAYSHLILQNIFENSAAHEIVPKEGRN